MSRSVHDEKQGGRSPVSQDKALVYEARSTNQHTYDVSGLNLLTRFRGDDVVVDAVLEPANILETAHELAQSPRWEDRLRAEALRQAAAERITLPNGFPCIYEPADSPRHADSKYPRAFVWVISPDEAMLHELLPLYRELWAAYEAQWPNSAHRTFRFGRLDRLSVTSVYRPGTTVQQVIGSTMLTHTDMYRTAPAHLKAMHPQHEQWTSRKESIADSNQEDAS